jgi:hypothetical protein
LLSDFIKLCSHVISLETFWILYFKKKKSFSACLLSFPVLFFSKTLITISRYVIVFIVCLSLLYDRLHDSRDTVSALLCSLYVE